MHPMHHAVCSRSIELRGALHHLRVVILPSGPFLPLIEYFTSPANLTKSPTWQRTVSRAVGFFYDFTVATDTLRQRDGDEALQAQFHFERFEQALLTGTITTEANDELELYWPIQKRKLVSQLVRSVSEFSSYCARRYGAPEVNPDEHRPHFHQRRGRKGIDEGRRGGGAH